MAIRNPYQAFLQNPWPALRSPTATFIPSPPLPGGTPNPTAPGIFVPPTAQPVPPSAIARAPAVPRVPTAPPPAPPPPPPPAVPTPSPRRPDPSRAETGGITGGGNLPGAIAQLHSFGSAAPPGFAGDKWADPTHQTLKYIAGRHLAGGGTIATLLQRSEFAGWTQIDDDNIRDPQGNVVDVWYAIGSPQQRPQWLPVLAPGPGGGGGGAVPNGVTGGAIPDWIANLFGPGGQFGPPPILSGANLPAGFSQPGNVGTDPLSQLIDAGLAGAITGGGATPYGQTIAATLADLISRGGVTPAMQEQLLGARETAALGQQSLLEDVRAALAESGGLSTPGVAQGPTTGAIRRVEERIAPEFAGAIRDIYTKAIDTSNESTLQALSLATGLSGDQAQSLLGALGTGTARQEMLSRIALQQLAQDQDWSRFLAEHGLNVAQVEEEIRSGRIMTLIPLLQLFIQAGGIVSAGYI